MNSPPHGDITRLRKDCHKSGVEASRIRHNAVRIGGNTTRVGESRNVWVRKYRHAAMTLLVNHTTETIATFDTSRAIALA